MYRLYSEMKKCGEEFDYNWRDMVEEILTLRDKLYDAEVKIEELEKEE